MAAASDYFCCCFECAIFVEMRKKNVNFLPEISEQNRYIYIEMTTTSPRFKYIKSEVERERSRFCQVLN